MRSSAAFDLIFSDLTYYSLLSISLCYSWIQFQNASMHIYHKPYRKSIDLVSNFSFTTLWGKLICISHGSWFMFSNTTGANTSNAKQWYFQVSRALQCVFLFFNLPPSFSAQLFLSIYFTFGHNSLEMNRNVNETKERVKSSIPETMNGIEVLSTAQHKTMPEKLNRKVKKHTQMKWKCNAYTWTCSVQY